MQEEIEEVKITVEVSTKDETAVGTFDSIPEAIQFLETTIEDKELLEEVRGGILISSDA